MELSSLSSIQRRVIKEFIELYRSEPCLWKVSIPDYHNRLKKEKAYNKLLEKFKEIEPDADRKAVVKKINNLRTSARKERKKYETSLKSAQSADEVEPPKLWYYNLLSFLTDLDSPLDTTANLKVEVNTCSETNSRQTQAVTDDMDCTCDQDAYYEDNSSSNSIMETTEHIHSLTSQIESTTSRATNKTDNETVSQNNISVSERDNLTLPSNYEDRCDIFGKLTALKLRGLENRQRLLAEKLINDVLFEAELGNLNLSHLNIREVLSQQTGIICKSETSL